MDLTLTQTNEEDMEQIVKIIEPGPRNREERRKQEREKRKRKRKCYSIYNPYIDWGKSCDYIFEESEK